MTLTLRYAARSDRGLIRDGNQDSVYAGPRLLAVADGMGGTALPDLSGRGRTWRDGADPAGRGDQSGPDTGEEIPADHADHREHKYPQQHQEPDARDSEDQFLGQCR